MAPSIRTLCQALTAASFIYESLVGFQVVPSTDDRKI